MYDHIKIAFCYFLNYYATVGFLTITAISCCNGVLQGETVSPFLKIFLATIYKNHLIVVLTQEEARIYPDVLHRWHNVILFCLEVVSRLHLRLLLPLEVVHRQSCYHSGQLESGVAIHDY